MAWNLPDCWAISSTARGQNALLRSSELCTVESYLNNIGITRFSRHTPFFFLFWQNKFELSVCLFLTFGHDASRFSSSLVPVESLLLLSELGRWVEQSQRRLTFHCSKVIKPCLRILIYNGSLFPVSGKIIKTQLEWSRSISLLPSLNI